MDGPVVRGEISENRTLHDSQKSWNTVSEMAGAIVFHKKRRTNSLYRARGEATLNGADYLSFLCRKDVKKTALGSLSDSCDSTMKYRDSWH
jgi:hypothetical protein